MYSQPEWWGTIVVTMQRLVLFLSNNQWHMQCTMHRLPQGCCCVLRDSRVHPIVGVTGSWNTSGFLWSPVQVWLQLGCW